MVSKKKKEAKASSTGSSKLVSITEAAKIHNVTRQAIYVAIKANKLKAHKETSHWMIDLNDLKEYKKMKYSRTKSTYKGELLFDSSKGHYSVGQVAKMLNVPAQKVYYAARSGYLKSTRKGAAWVILASSLDAYKQKYLGQRRKKRAA